MRTIPIVIGALIIGAITAAAVVAELTDLYSSSVWLLLIVPLWAALIWLLSQWSWRNRGY